MFGRKNSNMSEDSIGRAETGTPQEEIVDEPLVLFVEYIDGTSESISIDYNVGRIISLVGEAMRLGTGLNFTSANPPFIINARNVKKVTIQKG